MIPEIPVSVLIAPLDWGLGHATRCIPLIKEFITQGAAVRVASSAGQLQLIQKEFPDLICYEIPGYGIRLHKGPFLKWDLLLQSPGILGSIRSESRWLNELCRSWKPDIVVSDNRYGMHIPGSHCIFMTHQLAVRSGFGRWADRILMNWNYRFIKRFSSCWVPDEEGACAVAGSLSHPPAMPGIPVHYIGILSRFQRSVTENEPGHLVFLISGPEPQRTVFEKQVFSQLMQSGRQAVVLRGMPDAQMPAPVLRKGVEVFNHLDANALAAVLQKAEIVVARSGYSTVMDLLRLRKKSILIPTPGQGEQELLAAGLFRKNWALAVPQNEFNLEKALYAAGKMDYKIPDMPDGGFKMRIKNLMDSVRNNFL
jgi:UDP:flavonoid glycosyltransferase YjiC (YdhE family)